MILKGIIKKSITQKMSSRGPFFISIPETSFVFILDVAPVALFAPYFQENGLILLLMTFFSFGLSLVFVIFGHILYRKAFFLFNDRFFQVEESIVQGRQKIARLSRQNKILVQAGKARELLMGDLFRRLKGTQKTVYRVPGLCAQGCEEEPNLLLEDWETPLGVPQIKAFHLRETLDRVLTIFAREIEKDAFQVSMEDNLKGDTLENDSLILSLILVNMCHICLVRLPEGGKFTIRLLQKRDYFQIHLMDDGYPLEGRDFLFKNLQNNFFFLTDEILSELCASLHVKMTTKNKIQGSPEDFNNITLSIPLKIKNGLNPQKKEVFPQNVIRFPRKRHKNLEA